MDYFKVSHQPAKSDAHRHCGKWDIMISICHVILQDYVPIGWVSLLVGTTQGNSPSCKVWYPAIATVVVEIKHF